MINFVRLVLTHKTAFQSSKTRATVRWRLTSAALCCPSYRFAVILQDDSARDHGVNLVLSLHSSLVEGVATVPGRDLRVLCPVSTSVETAQVRVACTSLGAS